MLSELFSVNLSLFFFLVLLHVIYGGKCGLTDRSFLP